MLKPLLILVGVSVALLLTSHWSSLTLLIETWNSWPEYEYGYMVPIISIWLIWQRREFIKINGSWLGLGVVLLGALISLSGQLAMAPAIVQYAFVIIIFGFALSLTGWEGFNKIAAPLFLLFFMVPLPTSLHIALSNDLQWLSSELGVSFLHAVSVPAYLDGNVIDLGVFKLQVVEACNGLRYLLPITTLSFICGFMFQGSFWIRGIIALSGIPLAILMNGFRLGVTGIMVNGWGVSMAEGFMHDFQGWAVYVVSLAILILEIVLINWFIGNGKSLAESLQFEIEDKKIPTNQPVTRIPKPALAAIVPLLFLTLASNAIGNNATQVERKSFAEFPMIQNNWHGQPGTSLTESSLDVLGLDDYLLANFTDGQGQPINLYAAYYKVQKIGKAIHTPKTCLPSNGWTMTDLKRIEFTVDNDSQTIPVNRAVLTKDGQTQLIYYWFQQAGRSLASPLLAKWHLFKDSVTRGRGDSALVRLVIPVSNMEALDSSDMRLQKLVNIIYPHLNGYIPD
ncbi:MAG: VPLPA-CTERM-specific exosortase XrtD [Magnetococcales bacterium]|nr:VPLPA-CTERM-specific exosortase XrtD [Magnetococcales bacterium]